MGKGEPGKPKGRMTSYAFFLQTCRGEHKKKHPDESVSFQEFSKKCSDKWKKMNNKEKQTFVDFADKDKQRYEKEMKNYTPTDDSGAPIQGKKRKQKKDPNAPKRALSAFFFYCKHQRPGLQKQHSDWGVGQMGSALGAQWRGLSDSQKAIHQKEADDDKIRYARVMTDKEKKRFVDMADKDKQRYEAEMKNYTPADGLGAPVRGKKRKQKKDPNAPKRALSAFFFYCKHKRPDLQKLHSDWGVGQMGSALGAQWRELSDTEKALHQKEADADKIRYERAMAAYNATGGAGCGAAPAKKSRSSPKKAAPPVEQSDEDDNDDDDDDDDDE